LSNGKLPPLTKVRSITSQGEGFLSKASPTQIKFKLFTVRWGGANSKFNIKAPHPSLLPAGEGTSNINIIYALRSFFDLCKI
jgi:hypothetical protein